MSFGDHLEELRSCLVLALVGMAVATLFALGVGKHILAVIYRPLLIVQYANGLQPQLQVLAPAGAFLSYLKIAVISGLILSMPWVLFQIWRFIASGLYPHERRFARLLILPSIGLFALGVLFLYFIVLPIVLQFFISFNKAFGVPDLTPTAFQKLLLERKQREPPAAPTLDGLRVPVFPQNPQHPRDGEMWVNSTYRRLVVQTPSGPVSAALERGTTPTPMQSQFAIDFYISFVLLLMLAFGIAFETPIVVFFLAWTGLVTTAAMRRARRHVVLVIVVAAAILTPPDVVSQLLLAGPMYLLFEAGVWIARLAEARQAARAEGA